MNIGGKSMLNSTKAKPFTGGKIVVRGE